MTIETPKSGIITIGDGRGFVVQGGHDHLVITMGHCLPRVPPCMSFSSIEDRTYGALLGPLGGSRTVWPNASSSTR